jgi:hypothetical protein
VARCKSAFGTKSYIYVGRGPAAAGAGGGSPGQGNTSSQASSTRALAWQVCCLLWVGCVPLCYGINSAMRNAWWLVADCLRCTLHVRTPPISQLPTAPPYLLFLLSAGLQVAGRCRCCCRSLPPPPCPTPSRAHPPGASYAYTCGALQPPTWWSSYAATYSPPTCHFCSQPASRSLPVLLPIPDPHYHPLVLARHQPTLPPPPVPTLWCPTAARSYPHHGCPSVPAWIWAPAITNSS